MNSGTNRNLLAAVAAASLVTAGSVNAQDILLQFSDVGSESVILPAQDLSHVGGNWSSGYNGVYQFTIGNGLNQGDTFWTTCFSPGGEANYGQYPYTVQSFATASPGAFPASWATGPNGEMWGIQSAAYLWQKFGVSTLNATTGLQAGAFAPGYTDPHAAGAGLEMAIYVALYDSSGYGTLSSKPSFVPDTNPSDANYIGDAVLADMNHDLAALNPAAVSGNITPGYMLVPDPSSPSTDQQEFILFAPDLNNVSVPEPVTTSILGGMLAVVAFAGGSLRRKFLARAKQGTNR